MSQILKSVDDPVVGCSFSAKDARGGKAVPVTLIVQLCHCHKRGECEWDELLDGYNRTDTFQLVHCNCNSLYEGQWCHPCWFVP